MTTQGEENPGDKRQSQHEILKVPEVRIDDTEENLEDLQEEWEMEDCEDLEYEFYEQEVSQLWFE